MEVARVVQLTSSMDRVVRDLMRRDFIRVSPDAAVRDVLRLMAMARVRALPVILADRLAGLVAHRDLALAALGLGDRPADAATPVAPFVRPVEPVSTDAPLSEAARRMIGEGAPCLVAADEAEDGPRVVGLLTEGDLLREAYRPRATPPAS